MNTFRNLIVVILMIGGLFLIGSGIANMSSHRSSVIESYSPIVAGVLFLALSIIVDACAIYIQKNSGKKDKTEDTKKE